MPAVFIRTLGVFQIIRDGRLIPTSAWESTKAPELLKILVAQQKPVPRKRLIELLWPRADPAVAGNQLSMLLSRDYWVLHAHTGAGPLASDGNDVWLDRTLVIVDVDQFLTRSVAALRAHRLNQRDAATLLHAAAAAYTGEFLPDDAHHDWAMPLADEVNIIYIAVAHALATIDQR